MAEAADEMHGTKSSSQAAGLSGSPSGLCFIHVPVINSPRTSLGLTMRSSLLCRSPEADWGLKEGMLWRWMLLTCAGCSMSISDLIFFSMFIILVGKIHKVQTYLACFAHVGGPLTSQQWELEARYLLPGLVHKIFQFWNIMWIPNCSFWRLLQCENPVHLAKTNSGTGSPSVFSLTSLLMSVSDIYVWACRLELPPKIRKRKKKS